MTRSFLLAGVVLAWTLLIASCGSAEGPGSPEEAYWTAREAIEDDRAQDAIDGFTERGQRLLAAHCLLQVVSERARQPAVEAFGELAERTGGEPIDLWRLEMKGGVEAAARHGIDGERLDALLARMTAASEGSGEDLDEGLRAEVDALADRNAFLVDLLPLAWISVFENASLGEVELDGSRATIPVRYLDSELERTPGTVELVRERGVWKVDAFQGG